MHQKMLEIVDVLDDVMGGSEVAANEDAAITSVLDEIGFDIAGSMRALPCR